MDNLGLKTRKTSKSFLLMLRISLTAWIDLMSSSYFSILFGFAFLIGSKQVILFSFVFPMSLALFSNSHVIWKYLNFIFAFPDRSNSRMKYAFKLKRSIAHWPEKDKAKCDGSSQEAFTLYLYTLFLCYTYKRNFFHCFNSTVCHGRHN